MYQYITFLPMNDATENLLLIDALRVAIRKDHNRRVTQKIEDKKFSMSGFDSELEQKYPQVGTGELLSTARKSAIFLKENPGSNKGMSSEKVDGLLKFLFKHKSGANLPNVVKIVKTFADGKFAHYAKDVKTIEESEADKMLAALGDTSDSPAYLKALRLFVELSLKHYSESTTKMANDKKKIEELTIREKTLSKEIKKVIDRLSNNKKLTPEDRKAVEEAKKMFE